MDDALYVVIAVLLSLVLAVVAYRLKMLTASGSVAAFSVGAIISIFGSLEWLISIIIFTTIGLIATKINFKKKKEKGLQEGKNGERNHLNILGVALAPCIITVLNFITNGEYEMEMSILFLGTLCVAAADTVASELGVEDTRVWLITTLKRVEPGTNGGISLWGLVTSNLASILVGLLMWVVVFGQLDSLALIPAFAGIVGNLLDSVVGALVEDKGHISKYGNNFITSMLGALVGLGIYLLIV